MVYGLSRKWSTKIVIFIENIQTILLKRLNDMGGRASFTGIITYPNADEMRQCLREQPLDKTMFETDCPFLAPVPLRGKKNTPENVAFTVKAAAQILGIDADELAQISTQNAKAFFGL